MARSMSHINLFFTFSMTNTVSFLRFKNPLSGLRWQADILGRPVLRPEDVETTALGAALAAGLGVGFWTEADISSEKLGKGGVRSFEPTTDETTREARYKNWCRAVEKSLNLDDIVGSPSGGH